MLEAARAGDRDAFGRLLEKYRPYLMAVAKRVLSHQPPGEWSSVVQAGTTKALAKWRQFRGETPGELLSWLAAVVRNQALDRCRKRSAVSLHASAAIDSPASQSTPSEKVSNRERASRLMWAVDKLPSQYRQIIELRFFEGLPHEQIAQRMDRSHDAVRSLLVRALRRLREELGEPV